MTHSKLPARLFGLAFICTFLSYGIGSAMVDTLIHLPDALEVIAQNPNELILAVLLMAGVHTLLNVMLPVFLLPRLLPAYVNGD